MIDFERIEIPTPFSVGTVNCYLFTGSKVTVIDPGPATDDAYRTLNTQLSRRGYTVSDIDRILVTHPHIDHFGLVKRITEEAGATVFAHTDSTDRLEDPVDYLEREQAFFTPFFRSVGVPDEIAWEMTDFPAPYSRLQKPASVDHELADGDSVGVGTELEVIHTPGHSPGAVCFLAQADSVVFTGDHLLPEVTPNPLLTLSPGVGDERTRSLPTYMASLRKLRSYSTDVGYGGHGELMKHVPERISETIAHHQDRKEHIATLVANNEPATAYDLMQLMFPGLPPNEMFSGMSEIIGHLDLLEDEDRVQRTITDATVRYKLQ